MALRPNAHRQAARCGQACGVTSSEGPTEFSFDDKVYDQAQIKIVDVSILSLCLDVSVVLPFFVSLRVAVLRVLVFHPFAVTPSS
jgi:hypothetical protein